jgi:16S rRNA (guanine527-N7)-methyltransferase
MAVKSATGAAFAVVNKRVEALPAKPLDWLFARAFAPLPRLLDWCAPLIDPKTQLLLHKGRQAADEIAEAAKTHSFEFESFPSLIDSDSVILRLHSLRSRR